MKEFILFVVVLLLLGFGFGELRLVRGPDSWYVCLVHPGRLRPERVRTMKIFDRLRAFFRSPSRPFAVNRARVRFVGRDFYGEDVETWVDAPADQGPGLYEFEWTQDAGAGFMLCGKVIYAASFREAVEEGPRLVVEQCSTERTRACCNYAFGNLPERVRRLPAELQGLDRAEAEARWKTYPQYDADIEDGDRVNPWRLGPVVSGRAGWSR